MKKTLQFDYFPVMRSSYVANELVSEGKLQDQLILQWNNSVLFDTIELSKETAEKKSISRSAEIVLQKNTYDLGLNYALKLSTKMNI